MHNAACAVEGGYAPGGWALPIRAAAGAGGGGEVGGGVGGGGWGEGESVEGEGQGLGHADQVVSDVLSFI